MSLTTTTKLGYFIIHEGCCYGQDGQTINSCIYQFETEEQQQKVLNWLGGSENSYSAPTEIQMLSISDSKRYFQDEDVLPEDEEEE